MFHLEEKAFEASVVDAMLSELIATPLLSKSPLGGGFRNSRGLAFTFKRSGFRELQTRFPSVAPFLARVMEPVPSWAPWPLPFFLGQRLPNAFYLNFLLLGPNESVSRHVDGTLRGPSGLPDLLPEGVSVLYLKAPERLEGGTFILSKGTRRLCELAPRRGMCVEFRGDLEHEVTALRTENVDAFRASLVCERYHLPEAALSRLPEFQLHSKASFQTHLENRQMQKLQITYHLVAREDFSDEQPSYTPQAFAEEGFVHTTRRREHVHEVANRYVRQDLRPYWVLTIDLNRFPGMWRYDAPHDEYPHLYAPIPQEAILQVEAAPRTREGEFLPLPIQP